LAASVETVAETETDVTGALDVVTDVEGWSKTGSTGSEAVSASKSSSSWSPLFLQTGVTLTSSGGQLLAGTLT
jgi:hypothetical protein